MGRGRVQLRRIENKANRQVTFSKRRSGLLKKAHEISVLCEADVAVIVFSAKGRLYEYSTNANMRRILDRYEQYFTTDKEAPESNSEQGDNCVQFSKMKFRIESLQKSQRQLMGEDLESLNLTELQHLEQQLENGLRKIKSRKDCLLLDSIAELQKKEKLLQEQNTALEKELKEKAAALIKAAHLEQQTTTGSHLSIHSHDLRTLDARINPPMQNPISERRRIEPEACSTSRLPTWMVHHVNG